MRKYTQSPHKRGFSTSCWKESHQGLQTTFDYGHIITSDFQKMEVFEVFLDLTTKELGHFIFNQQTLLGGWLCWTQCTLPYILLRQSLSTGMPGGTGHPRIRQLTGLTPCSPPVTIYGHFQAPSCSRPTLPCLLPRQQQGEGLELEAHLWLDALLDARPGAGRRGMIPKSPSQPFPRDLETTPEKKSPSP